MSDDFLADVRSFQFVAVATTCCATYDSILMFPREVEFVWSRRPTLPRALYIINRLMGLGILGAMCSLSMMTLNDLGCHILFNIFVYCHVVMELPGDALILWRVLALFNSRRKLRTGLLFGSILFWLAKILPLLMFPAINPPSHLQSPDASRCWPAVEQQQDAPIWHFVQIPAYILFQAGYLLLTRYNPHTAKKDGSLVLKPLLRDLLWEVAVWNLAWFALVIVNMVAVLGFYPSPPKMCIGIPVYVAWQCLGTCRLYLHLKASRWDGIPEDDESRIPTEPASDLSQLTITETTTWSSTSSASSALSLSRRRRIWQDEMRNMDSRPHREGVDLLSLLDEEPGNADWQVESHAGGDTKVDKST